MEKLTIYATGNERITGDHNISHYIIEKNSKFLDWLGELLEKVIEIKRGKIRAKNYIKDIGNGQEQLIPKNIKKMTDLHERYANEEGRVDVFYGDKRVYITFRKSRELREKFVNFVEKHAKAVKIKDKREIMKTNFNVKL